MTLLLKLFLFLGKIEDRIKIEKGKAIIWLI